MELIDKIEAYWTGRAEGYSEVNQGELATDQKQKWTENLKNNEQRNPIFNRSSYKMRFLARKGIKKGKNVLYFQKITGMINRKRKRNKHGINR